MNVDELYLQSALFNTLVFLWLASILSTVRILLRCKKRIGVAILIGALFGPIAFLGSWVYQGKFIDKKEVPRIFWTRINSLTPIVLISLGLNFSFYFLFM